MKKGPSPYAEVIRKRQEQTDAPTGPEVHDLNWLLGVWGPYFAIDVTDTEIFQRLDGFGVAIWEVQSPSERSHCRGVWIDWLKKNTPGVSEPWRMVDDAIKAGRRQHEVEKLAPKNGWCDMSKLEAFESPPSLIGDVIAEKAFVMMYGQYGSGKTFLSLDMALSVATGTSWHGADVRQGAVAYILGEGLGGIGARVAAWRETHGAPMDTPFRLLPQPIDFSSPAVVADLLASIATWTAELKLMVIDTMFRCFIGNEHSPEDMGAFIAGIDQCRRETGCSTLLLHHPGHNTGDRSRGHSALEQALDQVIKIERNKDSGLITMSCAKNRDGLLFAKRQFRLSSRAQSMTVETAEIQLTPSAEAALAALHQIAAWDGASHAAWYKATGQPNGTFNKALKVLQDGDYVEKSAEDQYELTEAGHVILGLTPESYSTRQKWSNSPKNGVE